MTLEEVDGCNNTDKKMETVSQALEELLAAAQRQECLTVGVYESAKLMNVDPDSVVLCVLATDDEEDEATDIALQIHFTLIRAFCCDNDINILRVSGLRRLEQVLCSGTEQGQQQQGQQQAGGGTGSGGGGSPGVTNTTTNTANNSTSTATAENNNNNNVAAEPRDLHCILVTNPQCAALDSQQALQRVGNYCEERRGQYQWVPYLSLQER